MATGVEPRRTTWATLVIAVVVGLVAAGAAWFAVGDDATDTAVARVRLNDDEVSWPYHESIIEAQDGFLRDPATRSALADDLDIDPDSIVRLDSTIPSGQAAFSIEAETDSAESALALADRAAAWLVDHDLETRTAAWRDELAILGDELDRATTDLAEAERLLAEADELEAVRWSEEVRELVQRRSDLENQVLDLETAIETRAPQLLVIGPASLEEPWQRRLPTAAGIGIGAALLAYAAAAAVTARR